MSAEHLRNRLMRISGRVVVVGSINADLTVATERLPGPGETVVGNALQVLPGGKSANQAVAAALLGADTSLIGALGNDQFGSFLRTEIEKSGVNLEAVETCSQPSGTAVITVDSTGENTIVVSAGANANVNRSYVGSHSALFKKSAVVGLCLESPLDGVVEAARIAHEAGALTVLNLSPYMSETRELLAHTDVLIVNEHELVQLLPVLGASGAHLSSLSNEIATACADAGLKRVIVTLGPEGSIVVEDGQVFPIQPFPVHVRDTTGCGDSFMGTLLASLASGLTLIEGAELASYVSARAAQKRGAQSSYLSREELIASLEL